MAKSTSFKDDKLRRENFANQLSKIIIKSREYKLNDSLVIALDSGWGTGKTTFIDMWSNNLEKNNELLCLKYNAWEHDDWNSALVTIIHELTGVLNDKTLKTGLKKAGNKVYRTMRVAGTKITKDISFGLIEKCTGINVANLGEEIINELKNEGENSILDDYKKYVDSKSSFKKVLEKISKEKKLVIFIDELDRCRPNYAIEVLETIKHLFDIENLVFVVSLDMQQLSHSIATIYGNDMDSAGYLRRFFDMHVKIPAPETREYLDVLIEKNKIDINGNLTEKIEYIFSALRMTLRDMDILMKNMKILIDVVLEDSTGDKMNELYIFMMSLKYKEPRVYNMYFDESVSHNDFAKEINKFKVSENIQEEIIGKRSIYLDRSPLSMDETNSILSYDENSKRIIIKRDNGLAVSLDLITFLNDKKLNRIMSSKEVKNNPLILGMKVSKFIERKIELFDIN
ncbi:MAG: KAP family NTPase [Clostridia bacterium]|jgi:hypothetical protein|nr:KAP family NTPase [Clostridia bacterium]